ncbi:MAG: hypothetical protein HY842_00920 [Bacteroidetes bacterium]|nr:hypothetical protein [Bacteroidota bacterium]
MRSLKTIFTMAVATMLFASSAYAYYDPSRQHKKPGNNTVKFREACTTAKAQIDQDVNNVRARLTTGGDIWWDRVDGKYVVPKVAPGQTEVSSIFAGAVWLGGFDPGGNLKTACQTYGNQSNSSDFWPGPLTLGEDGDEGTTTSKEICDKWDRFFEVSGQEIKEHLDKFRTARDGGDAYTEDQIPVGVKGWPGKRNDYFFSVHQFDLPDTYQGLAGFWDEDGDGIYDPLQGDFPTIEIRGCEELPPQFPDEMIFWIYNDEGGGALHGETEGIAIRMEVQVQAFGYSTNDQINDMTFQRFKLINRAKEDIDSTYFAMWADADLGCYLDDYVGCDVGRSLAYTYNVDAEDGQPGITCDGVPTYGTEIPIIGLDYFRGPRDADGNELGMSSFTYFNNPSYGNPPPGTGDPSNDTEFYRYLSGSWKDGTPFSFGNDAYLPGATTNLIDYAFVDDPDDPNGWSMCNPGSDFPTGLPPYDRRTVQASGPFTLQPGAVNELIIGAVWVPNMDYPCPDITKLKDADDIAQDLFDNCFDIVDGPDAPDVDWIELDREIIAVLTNRPFPSSNNYQESYVEPGIGFPDDITDTTYTFEGYLLYQVAGPNVGAVDFDDPTKARLVYQVDVRNGIRSLYNWIAIENPGATADPGAPDFVFYPEVKIEGLDEGVRHTFRIDEDQFATGDRRLINHRKYYFTALAYGTNNYQQFDPISQFGQRTTYLEGRNNIGPRGDGLPYTVIPRPILDRKLNASYGDGPVVTRIDGVGVGGNFVDISDETRSKILDDTFDGTIVYQQGRGPINVSVFNPLEVKDGEFEITFIDENMSNDKLDNDVFWQFKDLNSNDPVILSDKSLDILNEQIFGQYGFTITIGQTDDVGDWADETDGAIGYEQVYESVNKPFWLSGIEDGFLLSGVTVSNTAFDYVRHLAKWGVRNHEVLATIGPGYFMPYQVTDYRARIGGTEYPFYVTPAWRGEQADLTNDEDLIEKVNNVDIVFTSDKSLWSRCVVVEMFNSDYGSFALREDGTPVTSQGGSFSFDLRGVPSVGKEDSDGDGFPDPDGSDSLGMGWFPGYAIDVETGKQLNIFFGENSAYSPENGFLGNYSGGLPNGGDMMFNPSAQVQFDLNYNDANGDFTPLFSPMFWYAGGQHAVYVTSEDYDGCAYLYGRFHPSQTDLKKVTAIKKITWAGMPLMATGTKMLPYSEGLIPNDLTVKLRVDNPYEVETGTGEFNGYPTYRFKLEGRQAEALNEEGINEALAKINLVPNPYYAFSDYEDGRLSNVVKITNLPAKCTVTIYTLDGKFIRQYNRDELPGEPQGAGIPSSQIIPDIEWDLKNSKGIPIAAGVYLVHVDAPDYGERTLKWFGITRQFDPTGL